MPTCQITSACTCLRTYLAGVRAIDEDVSEPYYDEAVDKWVAPFVMAKINSRVVRRAALGYALPVNCRLLIHVLGRFAIVSTYIASRPVTSSLSPLFLSHMPFCFYFVSASL